MNWKAMKNLTDFTLVIPAYRRLWTIRQMKFWTDSSIEVYILDDFEVPVSKEVLADMGDNIHYYHMPERIEVRLSKVLNLVKTSYVATLCDDEFYIPSAIDHCIKFLKKNPDYVSCTGRIIGFNSLKGKLLEGINIRKIEDSNSVNRMHSSFSPYDICCIYSVQSTEQWKKSISIMTKNAVISPYLMELQLQLATAYQGKVMCIDELFLLRNYGNKPYSAVDFDRNLTLAQVMKTNKKAEEILKETATELAKVDGQDKEKIYADIKASTDSLWSKYGYESFRKLVIHKTLDSLPKRMKGMLEKMNVSMRWKSLMREADNIQRLGIEVDIKQLEEILHYIEGRHDED